MPPRPRRRAAAAATATADAHDSDSADELAPRVVLPAASAPSRSAPSQPRHRTRSVAAIEAAMPVVPAAPMQAKRARTRLTKKTTASAASATPSAGSVSGDPLDAARQELAELHAANFGRWQAELTLGFNLLFHGFGSKRALLARFVKERLGRLPLVVVNGYFPDLTIKTVMTVITAKILNQRRTFRSYGEHADSIFTHYCDSGNTDQLTLLVHSIDGPALRPHKVQAVLSKLAMASRIHLVASCDHINVGTLWDAETVARLNFVWHDLTTFVPYEAETSYETSLFGMRGMPTARSVGQVLRSLTPNARGIFQLLAQHQIAQNELAMAGGSVADPQGDADVDDEDATRSANNERTSSGLGMSFATLYQLCREEFLVNNDLTLRTHLTEFRDHQIVQTRRGPDGAEYMYIPLSCDTLRSLLDSTSGAVPGGGVDGSDNEEEAGNGLQADG